MGREYARKHPDARTSEDIDAFMTRQLSPRVQMVPKEEGVDVLALRWKPPRPGVESRWDVASRLIFQRATVPIFVEDDNLPVWW